MGRIVENGERFVVKSASGTAAGVLEKIGISDRRAATGFVFFADLNFVSVVIIRGSAFPRLEGILPRKEFDTYFAVTGTKEPGCEKNARHFNKRFPKDFIPR